MNFKAILKTSANVGGGVILGTPIFSKEKIQVFPDTTTQKIIEAIAQVEMITDQIATVSKEEKLAAASQIVTNAIVNSPMLTGSKVVDALRFSTGISKITDGWNDILKSLAQK